MKRFFICALLTICLLLPAMSAFSSYADAPSGFEEAYARCVTALCEQTEPNANGKIWVDLSGTALTTDEMRELFRRVVNNNPEFFYINSTSYSLTSTSIGFKFRFTGDELAAKKARYAELTEELFALHDSGMSDLETALLYHDVFAANWAYDLSYQISDLFNFLDQKKGVCNAYTLAYTLAMKHFGIPCTYARSDNMDHIWNVIGIDGTWYHVDVTHDDPTYDRPGRVRHTYFLTGAATTASLKTNATDMSVGAEITISETDHPLYESWADVDNSSFAFLNGTIYTVKGGNIVTFDPATGETETVEELGECWRVPGKPGYFYPINFSTVISDGAFLSYFDSDIVFAFDPVTGKTAALYMNEEEDVMICGLQFINGTMTAYLGPTTYATSYTPVTVWTAGDVTCDGTIDIGDVTAALDLLSRGGEALTARPADVVSDGTLDIGDITAILDMLSSVGDA